MSARLVLASLVLTLTAVAHPAAQTYRVNDIDRIFLASDINNRMQIVGRTGSGASPGRAMLWHDNVLVDLQHIGEAYTLLINDQGTIAGTRGRSDRSMSAFETDVSGSFFIERPLPPGTSRAIALTESGILLIRTEVSGSTVIGYFALYRSQLYDLRQFFALSSPDAIRAINDAGTIAGETGGQTAFLKGLNGALSAPWNEYGSANALGAGGHTAGYGWTGHYWTLNIRQPDGMVTRTLVVERSYREMHVNRSGTVVGTHLLGLERPPHSKGLDSSIGTTSSSISTRWWRFPTRL